MAKRFERQLDKATDSTLIDPNWDAIIECVDSIRGGEVPVKAAVAAIKKRYHNDNPHVAHHALLVLEACMKNCGIKFHSEIATKEFMEDLKNLLLDSTPDKVKNKILELLQCWTMAFKNKPEYKVVIDTHNLMKLAGFDFPHVTEADAMFIAESAPEWADGEECFRCRTAFGLITRKHHCRACGQIFCDKCSSKQSFLPQYGIEKQVRVCDGCYEKTLAKKADTSSSSSSVQSSSKADKPLPVSAKKTAEQQASEQKQFEEEINLAIALSQSEAEAEERERQRRLYHLFNGTDTAGVTVKESAGGGELNKSVYKGAAFSKSESDTPAMNATLIDSELARYLNKEYWQQRKDEQRNMSASVCTDDELGKTLVPTAPPPSESSRITSSHNHGTDISTLKQVAADVAASEIVIDDEKEAEETMEFCKQLKEQVTVMDNRIRSNVARNRSVVNDTAIQSLFIRLTEMHAQVMARMNKLEERRNYFESLQDNLTHIQDARQAVNALREDHQRQKQARIMEEQRLKQIQMQQKVDLMRQKKHEMILHQRQMALLRFQQQEQEMQMRRAQMMGQNMQLGCSDQHAEMPLIQTAVNHASMQTSGHYGAYGMNQAQLGHGMSSIIPVQNYPFGAHIAQNGVTATTGLQNPNNLNHLPVYSQEHQSTYTGASASSVLVQAGMAQQREQTMHSFAPYSPRGPASSFPAQYPQYLIQPQVNTEAQSQPQLAAQTSEELLITFD